MSDSDIKDLISCGYTIRQVAEKLAVDVGRVSRLVGEDPDIDGYTRPIISRRDVDEAFFDVMHRVMVGHQKVRRQDLIDVYAALSA